jgi:hypothetical protein
MIYSKSNLNGRRLRDNYLTRVSLSRSSEFDQPPQTEAARKSLNSQNKKAAAARAKAFKGKKPKGSNRRRSGPKGQGKATSLTQTQVNPAFGLPAMAFLSSPVGRPPVGAQSLVPKPVQGVTALEFAKDIADKVGGTVATATTAVKAVKEFDEVTGISRRIRDRRNRDGKGDGGSKGGGGGGSTNLNSSSSGGYSYDMMCNKPVSQKIEISTGIRSGLIVNPGERNNNDDFSSLYIMCGNLFKEDSIDTAFKDHIEKNIYPDVNREIQYNLNFDYELSLTDFTNWFYDMAKALEVYYALDSVDVYGKKDSNNNPGSRYLHTKITSSIRLKLNELRRVLNNQAIPPRLLQTVRYMYQYYKFSELPGAPLYRLCPGFIFSDQASSGNDAYKYKLNVAMMDELITKLNSHTQVHNKIFKAMPGWHVEGYCMPPSCDTAYYDPNFRTFWFNSCLTYVAPDGTIKYTREGGNDANFRYWLYSNNFDGLFYAMGSFNKTGEFGTRPGLWTPATNFAAFFPNNLKERANALCYNVDNSISVIQQTTNVYGRALQFDNLLTPYRIGDRTATTSVLTTCHNQDGSTQVAQECTFSTYRQAVWEVTEWLFKTS